MSLEETALGIELHESSRDANPPEPVSASLPPADGGWSAWLFLIGSFTIEMLIWGFPFSFGVLNDYYTNHAPFSSHPGGISAVGTTCSGIMYLGAPIVFALFQRSPRFTHQSVFYGLPIIVVAIALSSYATKVWHLILTQGILYAIGGGLIYYPIFIFIDDWFIRRKSLAFGVMWAGSGCGGLSGPLVLNWGLSKYGAATFLRGWAVALLLLIGPILYFVKPRVPISRTHRPNAVSFAVGFGFVKTRTFWILQLGNVVQGLGYFIPALYLPSYARTLHLTPLQSSLLLSLLNTASVPGVVLLSALCDRTLVTNVILISALGSTLSVFLLWGFSSSLPTLAIFAILYGFFAGGFTSTYAGMIKELRSVSPGADLGSIMGLISMGRGVGNVICGPISEVLLSGASGGDGEKPGWAYESSYRTLVVFTGITMALTLTPWVTKRLRLF